MTGKRSKNSNINAVPDAGTEQKSVKHKVVKCTSQEVHANNYAKQKAIKRLFSMLGMVNFWVKDFIPDLMRMNEGKLGRPFEYTDKMIYWALLIKGLSNDDYREVAGRIEACIDNILWTPFGNYLPKDFTPPDFTTIFRRLDRVVEVLISHKILEDSRVMCAFVKKDISGRCIECAVDSTALNLSNTNLWRKHKWGVGPISRGWIKIHALVDVDTNEIIAVIVTTDKMGDNTAFTMLTDIAFEKGHQISTIYADSAYEAKSNWMDSEARNYTLVVKFKKNCNGRANGSFARKEAAKAYLKLPYDEWRATTKYGRRWKSECTFSDFKRLISEHIDGITDQGIIKETVGKIEGFNLYKSVRADMIGTTLNGVALA